MASTSEPIMDNLSNEADCEFNAKYKHVVENILPLVCIANVSLSEMRQYITLDANTHTYTLHVPDVFRPDQTLLSSSVIKAFVFSMFPARSIAQNLTVRIKRKMKLSMSLIGENAEYCNIVATERDPASTIQKMWTKKGQLAASFGTKMHEFIENTILYQTFSEGIPSFMHAQAMQYFLFLETLVANKQAFFATELSIVDRKYPICGTIDALVVNADQRALINERGEIEKKNEKKITVDMYDWKFVKSSLLEPHSGKVKCGLGPLKNRLDTAFFRYVVQQNIYRYIVNQTRNQYNFQIDKMFLVEFITTNPSPTKFKILPVEILSDALMEQIICYALARHTLQQNKQKRAANLIN